MKKRRFKHLSLIHILPVHGHRRPGGHPDDHGHGKTDQRNPDDHASHLYRDQRRPEYRRPVQCMASASFRNPRPDDHGHRQRRRKRNAKDHIQPHRQPYRGGARVQYGRPGSEGLCFPLSGADSGGRYPSPGSHEQPVRHFAGVGRHHRQGEQTCPRLHEYDRCERLWSGLSLRFHGFPS